MSGREKIILQVLMILFMSPGQASATVFSGEGALYFDRGHYWIELSLSGIDEGTPGLLEFSRAQFVIKDQAQGEGSFSPSRIEVIETPTGRKVVILSSGKIKGKRCYTVIFHADNGEETFIGPVCDPFFYKASRKHGGNKGFFDRYIIPAFSTSGEHYRFNRLSYGYDFTSEKSSTELEIEPRFGGRIISVQPFFEYDGVTYEPGSSDERDITRRKAGLSALASSWVGEMKYTLALEYRHERESGSSATGETVSFSQSVAAEGAVRLDNLFDNINRHGSSVFKGIDLVIGHAWYDSNDKDLWRTDSFSQISPYVRGRGTWTVAGGLQLSYGVESYWPSSEGGKPEIFHRIRIRLLLRNAIQPQDGKSYHPDLELVLDSGRRFPLFEREEKISLGFTFDLFPW